MGILDYYRLAFSNKQTSFSDHVRGVDAIIAKLIENLPQGIAISDTINDKEYEINFFEEEWLSHKEFVLLHTLFYQYPVGFNSDVEYSFINSSGEKIDAATFLNANTGMLRLMKSILFLDFYNSLDLVYGVFSLYDMIPYLDLKTIPLSDKRDNMVNQKRYIADKIQELQGQYDVINTEYADYVKKVDNLKRLIHQVEIAQSVEAQKPQNPALQEFESFKIKRDKSVKTLKRLSSSVDSWKVDLDNLKINVRNVPMQKVLAGKIKKWSRVTEKLGNNIKLLNAEISNGDSVSSSEKTASTAKISEYEMRVNDLKEKLVTSEDTKNKVYQRLVDIKNSSNSLQMELTSVESKLMNEVAIVDPDKMVAKNIVAIDKEITVGEKLFRFLANYFISIDQSSFLTLADRRAVLLKIFPGLKMKSLSSIGTIADEKNFISVK